jgi:autotransporter adhesin
MAGINAGNLRITNVAAGVDDNDAVNVSQLKDVQQNIDDLGDRAVKYDGNVNDPKDTITLEGDNGTTITNLADGRIEAGSTDAVNGGQIHDMGESIADGMGGGSRFEDGKLITELNVGGNSYDNVNDALVGVHGDLSEQITNVEEIANAGWNVTDADGNTSNIGPNGQVAFVGDNNISVQQSGSDNKGKIEIALNNDITVNSITAVNVDAQKVTTNEIVINNGGPIINENGIDMSDNRITNVAPGIDGTDAVNVNQLGQATGGLQNQINDLRRQDKRLGAGIAAAMATASLPQAYLPGKTMMSMAAGTWDSESGMAIGFSGISDNGHWVYKLSGNATSRGDYGAAVGIGYQW